MQGSFKCKFRLGETRKWRENAMHKLALDHGTENAQCATHLQAAEELFSFLYLLELYTQDSSCTL